MDATVQFVAMLTAGENVMKCLTAACLILLCCFTTWSSGQQPSPSPDITTQADITITGSEARPVRISGGLMANNIVRKTNPKYPSQAAKDGIHGVIVMKATVDPQGRVVKLEAMSGPAELRDAAVECVRKWLYKPYILNGQPVFVDTTISVLFVQRS